jgi:hypothetical protein
MGTGAQLLAKRISGSWLLGSNSEIEGDFGWLFAIVEMPPFPMVIFKASQTHFINEKIPILTGCIADRTATSRAERMETVVPCSKIEAVVVSPLVIGSKTLASGNPVPNGVVAKVYNCDINRGTTGVKRPAGYVSQFE